MSDCLAFTNLSTFHLSVDERKALKHSLAKRKRQKQTTGVDLHTVSEVLEHSDSQ